MNSKIWTVILVGVGFVLTLFLIDWCFKVPVVEKSYSTEQIVRITIDGKEVPRSQHKEILSGRYEIKHVK
jgi:hypothetical protein